jgi:hypothetical protein
MRKNERDEAASIFDQLLTAAARTGLYSDECYNYLVEFCKESGDPEENEMMLAFIKFWRERP